MQTYKKTSGAVDRRLVAHSPDDGPIVAGVLSTRHADKRFIRVAYPGYVTGDCGSPQAPVTPFVYCVNCCCGLDMTLWVNLAGPVEDGASLTVVVEGSNDDFATVATVATVTTTKEGERYTSFSTCEDDESYKLLRVNVTAVTAGLNGWIYLAPEVC